MNEYQLFSSISLSSLVLEEVCDLVYGHCDVCYGGDSDNICYMRIVKVNDEIFIDSILHSSSKDFLCQLYSDIPDLCIIDDAHLYIPHYDKNTDEALYNIEEHIMYLSSLITKFEIFGKSNDVLDALHSEYNSLLKLLPEYSNSSNFNIEDIKVCDIIDNLPF